MKYLKKLEERFENNVIFQLIAALGFIIYFAFKWTWELVSDQFK